MIAGLASKRSSHLRTLITPLLISDSEQYPLPLASNWFHIFFLAAFSSGSFLLTGSLEEIAAQSIESLGFYGFLRLYFGFSSI
jgi:hypothetical protein